MESKILQILRWNPIKILFYYGCNPIYVGFSYYNILAQLLVPVCLAESSLLFLLWIPLWLLLLKEEKRSNLFWGRNILIHSINFFELGTQYWPHEEWNYGIKFVLPTEPNWWELNIFKSTFTYTVQYITFENIVFIFLRSYDCKFKILQRNIHEVCIK